MNEGLKLSNSHVQPMEQRLQTIQLSHPTHGTKASNCLTLMSNPWNKGFKPSDSHVQPMEQRLQTIRLSHPTHGTKASNHLTPTYNPSHCNDQFPHSPDGTPKWQTWAQH